MSRLKGGQQKDMNLPMQNMKPYNSNNEGKGIPNDIMGCNPLPTMGTMKKMDQCWI
jgi:hypothetical protein